MYYLEFWIKFLPPIKINLKKSKSWIFQLKYLLLGCHNKIVVRSKLELTYWSRANDNVKLSVVCHFWLTLRGPTSHAWSIFSLLYRFNTGSRYRDYTSDKLKSKCSDSLFNNAKLNSIKCLNLIVSHRNFVTIITNHLLTKRISFTIL